MLNKNNTRELVYLVTIDAIEPIVGSDNCECAVVGGWHVLVRKNTFKAGDIAVYFEIDSKVDTSKDVFAFLEKKHGKIKTQKYTFGGKGSFISQGLIMSPADFGWRVGVDEDAVNDLSIGVCDNDGHMHFVNDESRFLTALLRVVYADAEDNVRKAKSVDKYKSMSARHIKLARTKWWRWLMRREWGRKLLFAFFGKKKDKKNGWPSHIAAKTDVERIQNMVWVLNDKRPFVASEKVDGSSFSVMAERTKLGKIKQYVCSRNVVFESPNDKCYYDDNIYFEAYEKYDLKNKIVQIMNDLKLPNIAIQSEVFGAKVQRRDYSTQEHKMAVFHIVSNGIKFPMDKTVEICEKYGLPHVPIVDDNFILPNTLEELQAFVEGEGSRIDGLEREGIVFYDKETGQQYFKFVSPSFLMKYHG